MFLGAALLGAGGSSLLSKKSHGLAVKTQALSPGDWTGREGQFQGHERKIVTGWGQTRELLPSQYLLDLLFATSSTSKFLKGGRGMGAREGRPPQGSARRHCCGNILDFRGRQWDRPCSGEFSSGHSCINPPPVVFHPCGLNLGCPSESWESLKTKKKTHKKPQSPRLHPRPTIGELVGAGPGRQYLLKALWTVLSTLRPCIRP